MKGYPATKRIVPNAYQCARCAANCACVGATHLPDQPMRAKCPKYKNRWRLCDQVWDFFGVAGGYHRGDY